MIRNLIILSRNTQQQRIFINRFNSSSSNSSLNIETLEADTVSLDVIDNEAKLKEEELERKRNKSRLSSAHYNILHGKPPYSESKHESHDTLQYKRKLFGKYGVQSGIDVRLCWPTKEELEDTIEYERIAYPRTILAMIETTKKLAQEKQSKIIERQESISKKMQKLDTWINDLNTRIAKKEADAHAAKERREKLIEEVRRHFGYTVDPRDDKFKEMLEKKEKEQKKALKEARKKVKEEKMVSKILSKKEDKIENKHNVKE